jgi:4-hydroxy-tetrahydrodipicolinate reductase
MSYTVIQWGTGYTGRYALEFVLKNPAFELLGLKVFTEHKEGCDAGELVGLEPVGVIATRDRDTLIGMDADCVVFMPRDPFGDPSVQGPHDEAWVDDLVAILASGKNVVSPLAPPTNYVHFTHGEAFRKKLDDACERGRSTVLFAGLDPGFLSDALAVTMAGAVAEITAIRTWEMLDYGAYTEADVLASLGLGIRPDQVDAAALEVIKPTWGGSIHLMAQALGVEVESLEIEPDVYLSPETFTTAGGMLIEAGTIGAIRWKLSGIVDGQPKLSINHVTRMGPQMAPDWPNVGTVGGYRIEIDAFPPFVGEFPLALPGGTGSSFDDALVMTAARVVNAIQTVVEASPGYKTFLELPPLAGQNAMAAARTPAIRKVNE